MEQLHLWTWKLKGCHVEGAVQKKKPAHPKKLFSLVLKHFSPQTQVANVTCVWGNLTCVKSLETSGVACLVSKYWHKRNRSIVILHLRRTPYFDWRRRICFDFPRFKILIVYFWASEIIYFCLFVLCFFLFFNKVTPIKSTLHQLYIRIGQACAFYSGFTLFSAYLHRNTHTGAAGHMGGNSILPDHYWASTRWQRSNPGYFGFIFDQ